jgi:hypothetical protein
MGGIKLCTEEGRIIYLFSICQGPPWRSIGWLNAILRKPTPTVNATCTDRLEQHQFSFMEFNRVARVERSDTSAVVICRIRLDIIADSDFMI